MRGDGTLLVNLYEDERIAELGGTLMTERTPDLTSLVEAVKAMFGAYGPEAAAEGSKRLSDNLTMVEGGRNVRSGEHHGKVAFGALVAKIQAEADQFGTTMEWVRGDDDMAFSRTHARGTRNGRTIDTHVLTMYTTDDTGQIVEIRDLPYDWAEWEEFWA